MGFTRHWIRRPAQEPVGAYDALAADTRLILDACNRTQITITGPDGSGPYQVDDTLIAFNGSPSMESFVWARDVTATDAVVELLVSRGLFAAGERPGFVKTGRLPYDLAVAAVLRRAAVRYGPAVELVSDDPPSADVVMDRVHARRRPARLGAVARGGKRVKASLPDGVHTWSDGFSFKVDPTVEQAAGLARQAGARRFVFNWMLARINEQSRQWQDERDAGVPAADRVQPLEARASYQVFQAEAPTWWADARVSMWVYRKGIDDAVVAHRRFLQGVARYPRFAKKGVSTERCSFQGADVVLTEAGSVRLPLLGWVRIAGCPSRLAEIRRLLRRGRAKLLRVTVSRHADGSWWVSGSLERQARSQPTHPALGAPVVGADRGLTTGCVAATSAGVELATLPSSRHCRDTQRRLARAQRTMARRHRRGVRNDEQAKNYAKARIKAGRLHEQVSRQRANDLHVYSSTLVQSTRVVVLEDLNVAGMVRNRHLAKAFADQGLGELARQITYKMQRRGGQVVVADRWFPSSKRCSRCGWVKPKLSLLTRTYHCDACGLVIDRDLNAAVNLAVWGETALAHPGPEPNEITRLVLETSTVNSPTSGTGTQPAGQGLVPTPEGGDGSAAPAVVVPDDPGTRQLACAS